MSEEERARFREQRRKEREQAGDGNAAPASGAGNAANAQKRPAAGANGDAGGAARAPSSSGAAPASREAGTPPAAGVSSGLPRGDGAARPTRGPRQAKVKVMAEDGTIEEREVTIGISNRVHAEVLSGLKEGDRVIAGVREAERRPTTTQQGTGLGQQNMGGPGGMPGGMQGGAGAGARR